MTNRGGEHVLGVQTIFILSRRVQAHGHFVVKTLSHLVAALLRCVLRPSLRSTTVLRLIIDLLATHAATLFNYGNSICRAGLAGSGYGLRGAVGSLTLFMQRARSSNSRVCTRRSGEPQSLQ